MNSGFKNNLIIIIIIAGVLVGINFAFADKIKNFSYSQSFGIQQAIWQMAGALSFIDQDQVEMNKKLMDDNQRMVSIMAELELTKEENKFLKSAMKLGMANDYEMVEADAFGGGRFNGKDFSFEDSFLINKGKNSGIQKGFAVVISGKVLIGKISEVYDDFSRVSVITDKSSLVDIQIINDAKLETLIVPVEKKESDNENTEGENSANKQNEPAEETLQAMEATKEVTPSERVIAIAKGEGGFKMSLDMFPKDKDLNDGAIVMTSSLSGNYPAGYVVGRIKDPKKIDTETFKQAEIVPIFDPKLIDKVFVLKDVNIVKND